VIKSRRIRWVEHLARAAYSKGAYRVLMERTEGKNHLEEMDLDGRIILKWILKNWDWEID
jgi:hypothetical protein